MNLYVRAKVIAVCSCCSGRGGTISTYYYIGIICVYDDVHVIHVCTVYNKIFERTIVFPLFLLLFLIYTLTALAILYIVILNIHGSHICTHRATPARTHTGQSFIEYLGYGGDTPPRVYNEPHSPRRFFFSS